VHPIARRKTMSDTMANAFVANIKKEETKVRVKPKARVIKESDDIKEGLNEYFFPEDNDEKVLG
jgi:hypothetical protein